MHCPLVTSSLDPLVNIQLRTFSTNVKKIEERGSLCFTSLEPVNQDRGLQLRSLQIKKRQPLSILYLEPKLLHPSPYL